MIAAVVAPWLAPFSPDDQPFDGLSLEGAPLPPGPKYWLGTDTLGRDLLSRLLFGAHTSLVIGLVANGVAVAIGMIVGIVARCTGGFVGAALMPFTDLMMASLALLLAIVLAALLHPSLWIVALVIALVNWVQVVRIVYTETGPRRARLYSGRALARRGPWPDPFSASIEVAETPATAGAPTPS